MRNYIAFGTFAVATSLLVGCANEPPKCSDPATLSLAKSIVCKQILVAMVDRDCKTASLQNARPLRYEAAIKKLTCVANLVIPVPITGDAGVDTPMKYESQLDEQGHQVVAVYELPEEGQNKLVAAAMRLDHLAQVAADKERDRLWAVQAEKERAADPLGLVAFQRFRPRKALDNPVVNEKLQSVLKDNFPDFAERLVDAASSIEGAYLFGSGCKRNMCPLDGGAYAVNTQTGATYAAIALRDSIKLFGASVTELPPPLIKWYRDHNGKD